MTENFKDSAAPWAAQVGPYFCADGVLTKGGHILKELQMTILGISSCPKGMMPIPL